MAAAAGLSTTLIATKQPRADDPRTYHVLEFHQD